MIIGEDTQVRAYQDSGLFADVRPTDEETDFRAEIWIVSRENFDPNMNAISGLTLFLIPSTGTKNSTVFTELKDWNGATLSMVEKSEQTTL